MKTISQAQRLRVIVRNVTLQNVTLRAASEMLTGPDLAAFEWAITEINATREVLGAPCGVAANHKGVPIQVDLI